jgi:hypothetical protein
VAHRSRSSRSLASASVNCLIQKQPIVFQEDNGPQSESAPKAAAGLQPGTGTVHNPTMTLKNAALLALIGTILATAFLVWIFVFNFVNVLRGLAPPLMLFPWFIYGFACFSVSVFFYVFHRAQS